MFTFLDRAAGPLLSVLRIVTGLLFLQHGTMKMLHFPPSDHASPPATGMVLVAGLLELIGGALISVGLLTRLTAFVLSGEMAIAYFMAHAPKSFYPVVNGGDLAIMFCFTFLYLAAAGGGPWSVDSVLFKAKTTP